MTEIQWSRVAGCSPLMIPRDKQNGSERKPRVYSGYHSDMAVIQTNGCSNRVERKLVHNRLEQTRRKRLFMLNQECPQRLMRNKPGVIRPRADERIDHIGQSDDLSRFGNIFPLQPAGIPAAIPPFMLLGDRRRQPCASAVGLPEQGRAHREPERDRRQC
mgnify:CR=1 FL=1